MFKYHVESWNYNCGIEALCTMEAGKTLYMLLSKWCLMYMLEKNLLKHTSFDPLSSNYLHTLQAYNGVTHQKVLHRHYMGKMFYCTILKPSKKFSQALQKLLHHFLMLQCQQWHPLAPILLPTLPSLLQCPLHYLLLIVLKNPKPKL